MNERFKELAEQAGFVSWSDEEWKLEGAVIDWSSGYDNELAKFAELIVRECIDWCDAHATVDGTATKIAESIKEHFGVEE